jgi:hypothetical protein
MASLIAGDGARPALAIVKSPLEARAAVLGREAVTSSARSRFRQVAEDAARGTTPTRILHAGMASRVMTRFVIRIYRVIVAS